MLAGSNYFINLEVLIDFVMLYVSAFYGNHRADNRLPVINAGYRAYLWMFVLSWNNVSTVVAILWYSC
jgi:hypothetical protein